MDLSQSSQAKIILSLQNATGEKAEKQDEQEGQARWLSSSILNLQGTHVPWLKRIQSI